MGSKPTQLKDGVKPTPTSTPEEKPSATILSIIEKVKLTTEPKLWRLDSMPLNEDGSDRVEILIGRAPTRDGTRTFPAVVLRLVRNNNVVRDYVMSAAPVSYLLQYVLEFANTKKLHYLYDFSSAFRTTSRTVNVEVEGGEIE